MYRYIYIKRILLPKYIYIHIISISLPLTHTHTLAMCTDLVYQEYLTVKVQSGSLRRLPLLNKTRQNYFFKIISFRAGYYG